MRSPAARLSVFLIVATGWAALLPIAHTAGDGDAALDRRLWTALARHGFTARIESTLEQRIGRRIDDRLADLGRLLWFDTVTGLNNDNNCSGCHSPANGCCTSVWRERIRSRPGRCW
jgi:cytochrome c peroxidase